LHAVFLAKVHKGAATGRFYPMLPRPGVRGGKAKRGQLGVGAYSGGPLSMAPLALLFVRPKGCAGLLYGGPKLRPQLVKAGSLYGSPKLGACIALLEACE